MTDFSKPDAAGKMLYAEGLFELAELTRSPDLRQQAASSFLLGGGEQVLDHLEAQGFSLDDIEGMDEDELLARAGEVIRSAGERARNLDPEAQRVLGKLAWAELARADLRDS